MMPTFDNTRADYSELLKRCSPKSSWAGAIESAAQYGYRNRARYQSVSARLGSGMPWWLIAALHWRESSGSFKTHLHNGDPLTARTYHVPKGRPISGTPPFDWDVSADDALRMPGKALNLWTDWSLEGCCYVAERFNGFGYRNNYPQVKSPYLWSGTNIYNRGKYVADHVFNANTVDQQVGVVPIMLRMQEIEARNGAPYDPPVPVQPVPPYIPPPAKVPSNTPRQLKSWLEVLTTTITSFFTMDALGVFEKAFGVFGPVFNVKYIVLAGAGFLVLWVTLHWLDKHDEVTEDKGKPLNAPDSP